MSHYDSKFDFKINIGDTVTYVPWPSKLSYILKCMYKHHTYGLRVSMTWFDICIYDSWFVPVEIFSFSSYRNVIVFTVKGTYRSFCLISDQTNVISESSCPALA